MTKTPKKAAKPAEDQAPAEQEATPANPHYSLFDDAAVGSVKAAQREAGASSADLWMVPYDQIRVAPGFNVRIHDADYEKHLEWLTNQIVAQGYDRTKPMAGYVVQEEGKNVFYVTDGHSRHTAVGRAIKAGAAIEKVPMIVAPAGTSPEDLTAALVTSNAGRPLTPYEIAVVCKRLQGYGLSDKEIAEKLGFTTAYVKQLFDLLAAPKAVREMVTSGKVAASLAVQTVRKLGGKEAAQKLKEGLKAAEAKGKTKVTAKHVKKAAAPAPAPVEPPAVNPTDERKKEGPKPRMAVIIELVKDMRDYIEQVRVGDDAQDLLDRAAEVALRRKEDNPAQQELPLAEAAEEEL